MSEAKTAVHLVSSTTETHAHNLAGIRQCLEKSALIASLVYEAVGDDEDFHVSGADVMQGYGIAADLINQAYDLSEGLESDDSMPESFFKDFALELLYVRGYLRLLVTKAGATDFDRISIVGLTKILVERLLSDLGTYEQADIKQAP